MESREEQEQPQTEQPEEDRWSSVLEEVHAEHQTSTPWHQRIGVFFAWAGGIALATDVAAIIVLFIAALVSKLQFTAMEVSNWLFWASCALLFAGLFAPSASEMQESAEDRQARSRRRSFTAQRPSSTQRASSTARASEDESAPARSLQERQMRAHRRRLRRVYNPWRWRLWGSAGISFALTVLVGSLVT
jgi:hypothetical protein